MFHRLIQLLRRYRDKPQHVRPWALAAPVLVLLFCLPLLRPLRHPDPRDVSNDEAARLATIRAVAERRTLALDDASAATTDSTIRDRTDEPTLYADQPPVLGVLLGGAYWVMTKLGYTFKDNPTLVAYLLTLVAATMPVAVTSALVYRMGRLFELRRPWRMVLALSVVTGSGLIAYATVINSHAPAAALVVSAVACLVHVAGSKNPARNGGWIALAGLCAALAAAIEPAALVFVVLLAVCVPCMRWRPSLRVGALLLYLIGCTPPIVMHAALNVPITGDLRPGVMHPDLWTPHHPSYARGTRVVERVGATGDGAELPAALSELDDLYEDGVSDSVWLLVGRAVNRVLVALFGPHGILSHFPVLILGLLGIAAVMHRHWPVTTKALATATFVGALAVVFLFAWFWTDWQEPMFGARWFVLFLPLLLFWSGAWLRKSHHPVSWGLAIAALAFSSAVALIGATYPFPREGFPGYTAAGALKQLIVKPQAPDVREALARTPVRERGGLEGFGGDPRHGR